MITVRECLDVVKCQNYEIYNEYGSKVGIIRRSFINPDDEKVSLIFSNEKLIQYLDDEVVEIIPKCFEVSKSTSILKLEPAKLPFPDV